MRINAVLILILVIFSVFCKADDNKQEVKVLVALDFSGSLKTTSRLVNSGLDLAIQSHETKKRKYVLIKIDTGEDVSTITSRVEDAIEKNKPDLIVGGITSNQAIAIGSVAERKQIPYISPFATNPNVTEGRKFTFRACFDDTFQAQSLARFVKTDLKLKAGIVLYNSSQSYSLGIEEIFVKAFGGSQVTAIPFDGISSLSSQVIDRIKALHPSFILLPSYQIESAAVITKLVPELDKDVVFVGSDSWGGGRLFENVVLTSKTKFNGYYVQHFSGQALNNEAKKFENLLHSERIPLDLRFNEVAMNAPIAMGYDTMLIAIDVFNKSGSIPENIRHLTLVGATGKIAFQGRQTPLKNLSIFSITEHGDKFFKEFK